MRFETKRGMQWLARETTGWVVRSTICRWRRHRGIVAGHNLLCCTRCGLRWFVLKDGKADPNEWRIIGSPSVDPIRHT